MKTFDEYKEILTTGTMVFASWKVFKEFEEGKDNDNKPWYTRTTSKEPYPWYRRPVWSPLIVCDYEQSGEKSRWKNLFVTFYDINNSTYFKWNFKFCVGHLDDGTIHFTE